MSAGISLNSLLLHTSEALFTQVSQSDQQRLASKHFSFIMKILDMGEVGHGGVRHVAQHHRHKWHSLKSNVIFGGAEHLCCLLTSFLVLSGQNQAVVDLIPLHSSISYALM